MRFEIETKQKNCKHHVIFLGEICADCGKDLWC